MGICVNSMEREIREIKNTVPVYNSWFVFVERRVMICSKNGNSMMSAFSFLGCLSSEGNRKERCVYRTIHRCEIVERGGNVLYLKPIHTRKPLHLRVDVNRIFSLNVSFTKLHLCKNGIIASHCMDYMDLSIGNKSERYTKDRLPWTIISKHTSAMMSVNSRALGLHIELEYSITETLNHDYISWYGPYYSHHYHCQMERVLIAVETIYRIHVEISRCFRCKIIAHDGPHEIFPTILHKRIGPASFTSFSTSAHYSLVFMTNQTLFNTTVVSYTAVFVVYTTFTTTLSRPTQFVFDNNTRCNDNTDQVRSCVFKIHAPDDSNVKLTLQEIKVKGEYAGNDFAAGFVIYNFVGGKLKKVRELVEDHRYSALHGIPFTSTESTMYVVIFAYSVCASIFVQAVTIAEGCSGIFVRMNRPTNTAIVHFDNSSNIKCFRVQTTFLSRWKSGISKLSLRINPSITVLVDLRKVVVYRNWSRRCQFDLFSQFPHTLIVKSGKKGSQSYHGNITKVDWECNPATTLMITEIKTASCVLPCRLLFSNKRFEHSSLSCNVCHFKYLGGLSSAYIASMKINRTAFIDLHIYSSHCVTVDLIFLIDPTSNSKFITVDVNRNQTFNMASQLRVRMKYEYRCMIRLPKHALSTEYHTLFNPQARREPANFIWGEFLYRVMFSDQALTWTHTAKECQKYGGSILVVHNQVEYHQVEYLMHKFAIGVLYIGWKRKVNCHQLFVKRYSWSLLCYLIYISWYSDGMLTNIA